MEIIGPLQVKVMHHVWSCGSCTVHEVHDALMADPAARRLAYTTILTVMRNLTRRGLLAQTNVGRAHLFKPMIDEDTYKRGMLRHVRQELFHGDVQAMLAAVAADNSLDSDQADTLRGLVVAAG